MDECSSLFPFKGATRLVSGGAVGSVLGDDWTPRAVSCGLVCVLERSIDSFEWDFSGGGGGEGEGVDEAESELLVGVGALSPTTRPSGIKLAGVTVLVDVFVRKGKEKVGA